MKRKNNENNTSSASELLYLADELQQEKNELIALTEEFRRLFPFSGEDFEMMIWRILEFTRNMDVAYEIVTEFATEIQLIEDAHTTLYAPPSWGFGTFNFE